MKLNVRFLVYCLVAIILVCSSYAHPGRTDANGGHWNHSTGTYHYHTGEYAGRAQSSSSQSSTDNSGFETPNENSASALEAWKEKYSNSSENKTDTTTKKTSILESAYKAAAKENPEKYGEGTVPSKGSPALDLISSALNNMMQREEDSTRMSSASTTLSKEEMLQRLYEDFEEMEKIKEVEPKSMRVNNLSSDEERKGGNNTPILLRIVLIYVLHCLTAFAFMYSYDKVDLQIDAVRERFPRLARLNLWYGDMEGMRSWEAEKHISQTIVPAVLYFSLYNELQEKNDGADSGGFIEGIFTQLFSLGWLAYLMIQSSIISNWYIALLLSLAICSAGCFVVHIIYKRRLRIEQFNFTPQENDTDEYIMSRHYAYLRNIKETVWLRYSLRKVLTFVSFLIYFLFFFRTPSQYN